MSRVKRAKCSQGLGVKCEVKEGLGSVCGLGA